MVDYFFDTLGSPRSSKDSRELRPVGLPPFQIKGRQILTPDHTSKASVSMVDYFFGILGGPRSSKDSLKLRPVRLPPQHARGRRIFIPA